MRYFVIIVVVFCMSFSCKAQNPVVGLTQKKGSIPDNIYYKDIDGDLDKYVGTWIYANETTSFTITFRKVIQSFNGKWYDDLLVGDYKYVKNGVVVMDYLSRINDLTVNNGQHYIYGNRIIYPYQDVDCDGCTHMERRIDLFFDDPERRHLDFALVIRYLNINNVEKIQANLRVTDIGTVPPNAPLDTRIPYGNYTLIKQ
ncbi:DUF6705 family protein [Kordia sp.]|uniref:DUF6705 family protein n=1 Tax=Kordia sp. TaxID=1965332 RepID=UPI003D2D73B1